MGSAAPSQCNAVPLSPSQSPTKRPTVGITQVPAFTRQRCLSCGDFRGSLCGYGFIKLSYKLSSVEFHCLVFFLTVG